MNMKKETLVKFDDKFLVSLDQTLREKEQAESNGTGYKNYTSTRKNYAELCESLEKSRLFKKLYKITECLDELVGDNEFGYEPKIGLRVKGLETNGKVHEMCHWLLATDEQKEYPDFGLGEGFNSSGVAIPIFDKKRTDEEESLTCTMELIVLYNMMRLRGFSMRAQVACMLTFMDDTVYMLDVGDYPSYILPNDYEKLKKSKYYKNIKRYILLE